MIKGNVLIKIEKNNTIIIADLIQKKIRIKSPNKMIQECGPHNGQIDLRRSALGRLSRSAVNLPVMGPADLGVGRSM